MKKKLLVLILALALVFGLTDIIGFNQVSAKTKTEEVKATSITFKTTTGGDFVAGVCKMKITFKLSAAAKEVQLSIVDSNDDVVFTKTIKNVKKNKATTFVWDGKKSKKKYYNEDHYSVQIKVGKTVTNSLDLDVANGAFFFIRKSGFAGGDGSAKKPYQVKNLAQLKKVEEHNGEYFKQVADIDVDYDDFKGMFSKDNQFTGSYDGNNHSISNALLTEGLFHYIGGTGEVKDLTLTGCNAEGHFAGVLTSVNNGSIKKCKVASCNISQGSNAATKGALGGIAGTNYGKITNCEVDGLNAVDSTWNTGLGGICGDNKGNIVLCTVKKSELSAKTGGYNFDHSYAGGLSAWNTGNITNCSVSDTNVIGKHAGLFVGNNSSVVSGCSPKSSDTKLIGEGQAAV